MAGGRFVCHLFKNIIVTMSEEIIITRELKSKWDGNTPC